MPRTNFSAVSPKVFYCVIVSAALRAQKRCIGQRMSETKSLKIYGSLFLKSNLFNTACRFTDISYKIGTVYIFNLMKLLNAVDRICTKCYNIHGEYGVCTPELKRLRQYRTKIVRQMRSQIFR